MHADLIRLARAGEPDLVQPRLELLRKLAFVYDLEPAEPPATKYQADEPKRILVSGIGRSGTTLIYQQLAKLLLLDTEAVNFRYEPYLWNIRSGQVADNPFGNEQLHHMGLHTHLATPLFHTVAHPLHDAFLDSLFDAPWDRDPSRHPDAYLTKVIRGSGRLRAYLARYPSLKIVICLRNPLDTINSSLGMFSFFGEEFHENDRPRFAEELRAQGRLSTALPEARNAVEWYGTWWRAFTEESLSIAEDFPDNTFLFCHELFQQDKSGVLGRLQDFVGIHNHGVQMGLSKPAGPSISATSLNNHDLDRLAPHSAYYRDTVLESFLPPDQAAAFSLWQSRKFATGKFSLPIAGSDLGQKSAIQLRGMMLNGESSAFQRLVMPKTPKLSLGALIEQHGGDADAQKKLPILEAQPEALRQGKRFGVVITCHNNSDTIAEAVFSCLQQTLPFDEIVVVDDGSSDDSLQKLKVLADRYSALRLLPLQGSIGPAAAREMGIRHLTTDFFTQLDGDDLFWPTKNAGEVRALKGDESAVVFSDILLVLPDKSLVQSTAAYDGPGTAVFNALLSRTTQIPRDMTLSRALYFKAGGYNLTSRLYEDWDFKLRLAMLSGDWRRSAGLAGTLYNRVTPGLSGAHPDLHAKSLILIFLRALRYSSLPTQVILQRFDAALRPFADREVTQAARSWLEAQYPAGDVSNGDISSLAETRQAQALPPPQLAEFFNSLSKTRLERAS